MGYGAKNMAVKFQSGSSNNSGNQVGYETVIGKNLTVNGNVFSDSSARIDGTVNGDVKVMGKLLLGEGGKIQGNVNALNFIVSGTIVGNVSCAYVHVSKTGNVQGDITVQEFSAEQGAVISGKIITENKNAYISENIDGEVLDFPPPIDISPNETNSKRTKK